MKLQKIVYPSSRQKRKKKKSPYLLNVRTDIIHSRNTSVKKQVTVLSVLGRHFSLFLYPSVFPNFIYENILFVICVLNLGPFGGTITKYSGVGSLKKV